jgi:hypothetical protein
VALAQSRLNIRRIRNVALGVVVLNSHGCFLKKSYCCGGFGMMSSPL